MKRKFVISAALLLGLVLASTAKANVRHDEFYGVFIPSPAGPWGVEIQPVQPPPPLPPGANHTGSDWIPYAIPNGPTWWNTWFYNDPLNLNARKWIEYDLEISRPENYVGPLLPIVYLEVAINYSDELYADEGQFPLSNNHIRRQSVATTVLNADEIIPISGRFEIPDFNPVWVSIDVRGLFMLPDSDQAFEISGTIDHECVIPAPGALFLGGIGVSLVGWMRKRKTI